MVGYLRSESLNEIKYVLFSGIKLKSDEIEEKEDASPTRIKTINNEINRL